MSHSVPEPEDVTAKTAVSATRRWMRGIGLFFLVLAVLAGWYLIITYLAWQNGQDLLIERQQSELSAQLARQITLAQTDITEDRYALAASRLEWVLARSPNNPTAQTLLQQAQAGLNANLTPQTVNVTAVATTTPLPTPTPGLISDPANELARLRQLIQNREWEPALSGLITFQLQYPEYERTETDQLLYDTYIQYSITLLEGEKVELGLNYLSQAEKLGDLPQEAIDYRTWAELYLQGIAFYGVNWGASIFYFRDLCLAAPFFHNACDRLSTGLVAYGDQYAFVLDWCPAQLLYQEATQYNNTQVLVEKLNQAANGCLSATPTPITNTLPITGTFPITGTQP